VIETFKFSTDPELEPKIRDVVGLYLDPPAKRCHGPYNDRAKPFTWTKNADTILTKISRKPTSNTRHQIRAPRFACCLAARSLRKGSRE
jgi:hypothetical protein